jgi:hypothetical protein
MHKQPALCYIVVPAAEKGKRIGIVKRGETGYYETDLDDGRLPTEGRDGISIEGMVKELNARLGVSESEMLSLITQSMRRA